MDSVYDVHQKKKHKKHMIAINHIVVETVQFLENRT